jgi:hypothetical protein
LSGSRVPPVFPGDGKDPLDEEEKRRVVRAPVEPGEDLDLLANKIIGRTLMIAFVVSILIILVSVLGGSG